MNYLLLEEVDSTNSYASVHAGEFAGDTMIVAAAQTAGRGQRGNSWESEPGKNLTFTLFHRPEGVLPAEQFAISEATALGISDMLAGYGIEARVKWPNDIYIGDRKVCGILIEHSVTPARIEHSRIGAGVNVNQTQFLSDAPNPVSMIQALGRDTELDLQRVAVATAAHLERRLLMASTAAGRARLHSDFMARLWRGDSAEYPFRRRGEKTVYQGIIRDVDPTGPITIEDTATGRRERFMFKEVEFILYV